MDVDVAGVASAAIFPVIRAQLVCAPSTFSDDLPPAHAARSATIWAPLTVRYTLVFPRFLCIALIDILIVRTYVYRIADYSSKRICQLSAYLPRSCTRCRRPQLRALQLSSRLTALSVAEHAF